MASFNREDWEPIYLPSDKKEETRLVGIEFEMAIKNKNEIQEDLQFMSEEFLDEEDIGVYVDDDYDEFDDDARDYSERVEYMKTQLESRDYQFGGLGYDGGGKEIVTLPDSYSYFEQGGSERFNKLLNLIKEVGIPDNASGTHIHISKLKDDVKTTWNNLYWFCMCFGPQLQKIFGRISRWARTPLPKDFFYSNAAGNVMLFEAPKKQPKQTQTSPKGTIIVDRGNRYEFRGAKASNDKDEILAWVELCNNIVEVCSKGYIQDVPFADVLRGKYIRAYVNKIGKENSERKISTAERAMRISEIGYVKVKEISKVL